MKVRKIILMILFVSVLTGCNLVGDKDTTAPIISLRVDNNQFYLYDEFQVDITEYVDVYDEQGEALDITISEDSVLPELDEHSRILDIGDFSATFVATDQAGNSGTLVWTFTVIADTTAPTLSFVDTKEVFYIDDEFTDVISTFVSITDHRDEEIDIIIVEEQSTVPRVDEYNRLIEVGQYTIVFSATDAVGNIATLTWNITVEERDVIAPIIELKQDIDVLYVEDAFTNIIATFIEAYDDRQGDVEIHIDETNSTQPEVDELGNITEEGEFVIRFTATDQAGNIGLFDWNFTVEVRDVIAPIVSMVEPIDQLYTYDKFDNIFNEYFEVYDENGEELEIYIDEDLSIVPPTNRYHQLIKSGSYSIHVYAMDEMGNKGTFEWQFEVEDLVPEITQIKDSLTMLDLSESYRIFSPDIAVYDYNIDSGISYVNIEDFMNALEDVLVGISVEKEDVMTITFYLYYRVYENGTPHSVYRDLHMTLDANEDTILIDSIDLFDYMNQNPDYYDPYYSSLEYQQTFEEEVDEQVLFDLGAYDLDIVESNGDYFIPLYLADLFLLGPAVNVLEIDTELIVFDLGDRFDDVLDKFPDTVTDYNENVIRHTERFTAFFFDYFYGVKEFKEVTTYQDIIYEQQWSMMDNYEDVYRSFEGFVFDLDDLHTAIVSPGPLYPEFIESINDTEKSKRNLFDLSYEHLQCDSIVDEYNIETYDNLTVVTINQFTLNTVDLLNDFSEIPNGSNVVIDLSCNPGGALVGVMEILTYMTPNPIEITTYNQLINQVVIEEYNRNENDYVDANYFLITANSSYSAANLFASIYKDMELGLIIGDDTLGGASAIQYNVLPNGMILVSSSNYTLMNQDQEIIENGIDVDLHYDFPIDYETIFSDMTTIYTFFNDIVITTEQEESIFTIQFSEQHRDETITDVEYIVRVFDTQQSTTIFDESTFTDDFIYEYTAQAHDIGYEIQLLVRYTVNGDTLEEVLYRGVFDDHQDTINENLVSIMPGEQLQLGFYDSYDVDMIELKIYHVGLYGFVSDNDDVQVSIYSSTGSFITSGDRFTLSYGTYYLRLSSTSGIKNIYVREITDDTTEPVPITINVGYQQHIAIRDFAGDEESFIFEIEDPMIIEFSMNIGFRHTYGVYQIDGENETRISPLMNGDDSITLVLESGTYLVLMDSEIIGEVILYTSSVLATDDYQSYISENPEEGHYGTMTFGENLVTFEGYGDVDVYKLTITEETTVYYIQLDGNIYAYMSDLDRVYFLEQGIEYLLEPGDYYFRIQSNNYIEDPTATLFIGEIGGGQTDEVDNTQFELYTIIPHYIATEDDVDRFAFEISRVDEYELIYGNSNLSYRIYNDSMEQLYNIDSHGIFTLDIGTYYIEFYFDNVEFGIGYYNYFELGTVNTWDDHRNCIGLNEDYYSLLRTSQFSTRDGEIDYLYDEDVFLINLQSTGQITILLSYDDAQGALEYRVLDQYGNVIDTETAILEPGIYFVIISQTEDYGIEYEVWYSIDV